MMLLALATGIGQAIAQQSRVAIIPQPVSVKENPGSYLLPRQIVVDAPNMASLQYTQKWLQHKLTTATGYTMLFTQGKPATASIVLQQLQHLLLRMEVSLYLLHMLEFSIQYRLHC